MCNCNGFCTCYPPRTIVLGTKNPRPSLQTHLSTLLTKLNALDDYIETLNYERGDMIKEVRKQESLIASLIEAGREDLTTLQGE